TTITLRAPPDDLIEEFRRGSDRPVSTTMVFVRLLSKLLRDPELGPRIVPIVPDEARTFGMEALFRQQMERVLHEMDLVTRDEFEVVRLMAEKARAENEALSRRIAALEAQLAQMPTATANTAAKPAAKPAAKKPAPRRQPKRPTPAS
ncbi:MAG: accessory factor UbiK family protein, partial [Oceanibaculum sp.]